MTDKKHTPKPKTNANFDQAIKKMAHTPPVSNEELKKRKQG